MHGYTTEMPHLPSRRALPLILNLYSFCIPQRVGGWVLMSSHTKMIYLWTIACLGTNCAQRKVTADVTSAISTRPNHLSDICTLSENNIPHLVCYSFDIRVPILIFFSSRNVTDKVSNQNMLYYATSNNLCFCTTWQSGETWKLRCSLKCCISAPVAAWFLQFFWVTTHTLLYDSINLVINAFSSGLLGAWFRRKEVESAAAVGLCCRHNVPVHCILSFLFRKVMLKRWVGEVGKQSIVWFLTFL